MAENATTTAKPLSAAVSPEAAGPLPGTRARVMAACAEALRAAAADVEDPRTTPLPGVALSRRQLDVASWLRRRADLLTPPAVGPYERNQLVGLATRHPDVRPEVRAAVAEALHAIGVHLSGYGVDARQLPHLVDDLVAAFVEVDAYRVTA